MKHAGPASAKRTALGVVLATLGLAGVARADGVPEAVLRTTTAASLRVQCAGGGASGSGFVWGRPDRAVTALHVVAQCPGGLTVYFEGAGGTRAARLVRSRKFSDLAELQIESPPAGVAALSHAPGLPPTGAPLAAVGFPLAVPRATEVTLRQRLGQRRLSEIVPDSDRAEIQANGFPALDLAILNVEGHLLPGMSGGPIVDAHGRVVGIADGGLERGAASISWGIPAAELDALATSAEPLPGASPRVASLFSAESGPGITAGPVVQCGSGALRLERRRAFRDLAASSDDPGSLAQLAAAFAASGLSLDRFEYDIYVDARSGAAVAVPATAPLTGGPMFCTASLAEGLTLLVRLDSVVPGVASPDVRFELDLAGPMPQAWMPDPQWSYLAPIQRFDGMIVRRKAFTHFAGPMMMDAYMFETLAMRGPSFVGAAALNQNACPIGPALAQACMGGPYDPVCAMALDRCLRWAHLAMGIQLTSFAL